MLVLTLISTISAMFFHVCRSARLSAAMSTSSYRRLVSAPSHFWSLYSVLQRLFAIGVRNSPISLGLAFSTSVLFSGLVSVVFASSYVNATSSSSACFLASLRTDLSPLVSFLP